MRKKNFLAVGCLTFFLFSGTAAAFSDTSNHRYKEAVDFVVSFGIVNGYPDGTFRPERTLNRAELLKMVLIKNHNDAPAKNCFTDVKKELWYSKFACRALELGIVQGYSDGSFQGGKTVTFVEALKILLLAYEMPFEVSPPPYWFQKSVEYAADRTLIPLDVLSFNQLMTRGQMAEFITRFYKYYEGKLPEYLGDAKDRKITFDILKSGALKKSGKNCYLFPNLCRSNELCLQNSCVKKTGILPQNEALSESSCKFDEVYRNGICEKAKMTILFAGSALPQNQESEFMDFIDRAMAGWIATSPLKSCPDRVRIHREFNFCAPPKIDVSEYLRAERRQKYDAIFLLHPLNIFDKNCSDYSDSLTMIPINYGTLAHELGHIYGLWDQYCYWPIPENPNPVDFEEGVCAVAKNREDNYDFDFEKYCRTDKVTEKIYDPPYQCLGNFNPLGGRTIMGIENTFNQNIDFPLFGFTKAEFDIIKTKLNCE